MLTAIQKLFKDVHPRLPNRGQTETGKEFLKEDMLAFLKPEWVQHLVSNRDKKAPLVERFNRTVKLRHWTYFTAQQTRHYGDILQNILDSSNNTYHREIGRAPNQVTKKDEKEILERLYGDGDKEARSKISEERKG